jgi:hypothetical protein
MLYSKVSPNCLGEDRRGGGWGKILMIVQNSNEVTFSVSGMGLGVVPLQKNRSWDKNLNLFGLKLSRT